MSRRLILPVLILGLAAGCQKPAQPLPVADIKKDYDRPLPPGAFALRKVDPSMYPNFGDGWFRAKGTGLREAVQYSIAYMNKPSSKKYFPLGPFSHDRALASLQHFLTVLDRADSPETLDRMIRQDFEVWMSIGCDDEGTVLFTGYYSPIFEGSLTQSERFKYPLYKLPPDLKKDEEGNPIGGPWRTRQEIEQTGLLAGQELAWLSDPFETYVLTVQGSGFLKLEDGRLYEVGYAGHNGHDYTPIGRQLVADGKIAREKLSLDAMIRYFKEHPEDLDTYMYQNKRFVFFQDSQGGPYGCLGQRVTPYHSVATDKEIFPRACLSFLDTFVPRDPVNHEMRPYRSFVLDQDRGAAIRAPGRCDIYMGVGPDAGQMAGFTYSEGRLYYLFLKEGGPQPEGDPVARGEAEN